MNDRGFVTVSMIFWIPVILISLMGAFFIFWFLQQRLRLHNLCHYHLLKSQEALVQRNNEIMALNSKAKWLWGEKKALDLVILTGPPPAKAVAKVKRKTVVMQQKALNLIQNGLFRAGEAAAQKALFDFQIEFKKQIREWKRYWQSPPGAPGQLWIDPRGSALKVAIRDIANAYRRPVNHSNQQKIRAQWSVPLRDMLPRWLHQWVSVNREWKGQCFTHPHAGGIKWKASIGEGKH